MMPFKKREKKPTSAASQHQESRYQRGDGGRAPNGGGGAPSAPDVKATQLVFHCQLAHGSPTVFVSGFANVRELYAKIAGEFDMVPSEIMFCTLNTHKIDMNHLLAGQIGLEDFIFAHQRGRPKEVELTKDEGSLGLTITDNGSGLAFIKRIKDGSVVDRAEHIKVGDHIEKLDGRIMVGKRHHEVARILKEIPVGTTFTMRLVEPVNTGFVQISRRENSGRPKNYGSGTETIRFPKNGKPTIQKDDESMQVGVEKINSILDGFFGIHDTELAMRIWEMSDGTDNSMEFAEAVDSSDLEDLGFTDDLIIELWGAITDARAGRLK